MPSLSRVFTLAIGGVAALLPQYGCAQAADNDMIGWYPFNPRTGSGPSVIDVSDWLDAPAGKHGVLTIDGERLVFADGVPIKFWGTNICEGGVSPSRDVAQRWSSRLAAYGINCVRFHKFTYSGRHGLVATNGGSTDLDLSKVASWDYFVDQLKQRGIYFGLSPVYGHRLLPPDRDKVLAYDEIMANGGTTRGLVNFAPDLQDLHIELLVNLLNHTNTATGLRYADDPALVFVEIQNEDDIFFGFAKNATEKCPTYRNVLCKQFADWLSERYGNSTALEKAWGRRAFEEGESLERATIYPIAHHWWYSEEGFRKLKHQTPRLLDTAEFLADVQDRYYARVSEAIRSTGYKGPIIGSNWQAGSGVSHLYNLRSDARAGIVDRHIYSGGGTGHTLRAAEINTLASVSAPGSGLLGVGRQAVANRPFFVSEWMACPPNEWVAEGAPLMAMYGLGLQGWDGVFSFATNHDRFTSTLDAPTVYNVDSPLHLPVYPALAMMLYRGDLEEGARTGTLRVFPQRLRNNDLGFRETVDQKGDIKSFSGTLPSHLLALGQFRIDYAPEPGQQPADALDTATGGLYRATTGQLLWDGSDRGHFTIDTAGTQGVVGFAAGKTLEFRDVSLTVSTPFAVVLVSSMDKTEGIAGANRLLVTAQARGRNAGMKYGPGNARLLDKGRAPVWLEPVEATITLKRRGSATVHALDHLGGMTDQTVSVEKRGTDATFVIGEAYRTMYYLVQFE